MPKEQAEARLAAAVAAGGRIVYESEEPGTVILSDKSGNKVCIASWPDRGEFDASPGSAVGGLERLGGV